MKRLGLAVLALVAAWAAVAAAAGDGGPALPDVGPHSVELSPSVQLTVADDWWVVPSSTTGQPWSRCLDIVWRAVKAGSSRLNFVPTHHWLPDEAALNGIASLCTVQSVGPLESNIDGSATYVCTPFSADLISKFRDAMTLCFAEALRNGMTLYIRPHLDDGTRSGAWRNGLLLHPSTKYNGTFSYEDVMLVPLADALRAALDVTAAEGTLKAPPGRARPVVYFALQGEMSATIMRFTSAWRALIPGLKQRLLASTLPGGPPADVKIGIGLNFNRLDDTTSVSKRYSSSRISWLMWQAGMERPAGDADGAVPPIQTAELRSLMASTLDFVGISAYAPYNGDGLREYENSAHVFGNELQDKYGIDIRGLVDAGTLELHYSEFGIGGGAMYTGVQPAGSPAVVRMFPFFGLYGRYSAARDPWRNPANKAFRREFYARALQWLADPENKSYKISSCFIWSMASWDVLGLYPESTGAEGSYRDEQVAAMIAAYNEAVRAAAAAAAPAPDVANAVAASPESEAEAAARAKSDAAARAAADGALRAGIGAAAGGGRRGSANGRPAAAG